MLLSLSPLCYTLLCLVLVLSVCFLRYWHRCMRRAESSTLHHLLGAKIRPRVPVRLLNLVVMLFRRVTGGFYLLKFSRFTFLPDSHYPKEARVLSRIGPQHTISSEEVLVAQRKGLQLYNEALDDPGFCWSAMGRIAMLASQKREFLARQQIVQYALETEGLLDEPPVDANNGLMFITGLPRTGSTFLQALLALDPNARSPRTWEMWYPVPPSEGVDNSNHPNVKHMKKDINSIDLICPNYMDTLRKTHYFEAEATEEDTLFMYQVPWRWNFSLYVSKKDIAKWWFEDKTSAAFACKYLHLCLKTMVSKFKPKHIVSKNPGHAHYIEALLKEFPKANIICTHRNPVKVVSSWSKICLYSWHLFFQNDFEDPNRYEMLTVKGHRDTILEQLTLLAKNLVTSRENITKNAPEKEKQFFDVCFSNLISDPVATVKSIYAQFGYEFTDEFERRIVEYVETQPRNKYGRAPHNLAELGTTAEHVSEVFASYIDKFQQFF